MNLLKGISHVLEHISIFFFFDFYVFLFFSVFNAQIISRNVSEFLFFILDKCFNSKFINIICKIKNFKAIVLYKFSLSHPVCLTSEGEITLEMEKVLNSMPNGEKIKAQRVLEINPEHEIFNKLKSISESGDKDKLTKCRIEFIFIFFRTKYFAFLICFAGK